MSRRAQRLPLLLLVAGLLAGGLAFAQPSVLVFSKTEGFRHGSISDGISMLQTIASQDSLLIETSEDAADFNAANLARFRAVVWLSTTGDVLNGSQQAAFEAWLSSGGGYVGIHAAADCEYGWAWYGEQVLGNGAWFQSHPAIQTATVVREDATDISTSHLPPSFDFTDEWYNFRENPRAGAQVLLTLDESSYTPGAGAMGADHPISWKRSVGSGRAWYTALGHRTQTFADTRFIEHVRGGLFWAVGRDDKVFSNGFE